MIKRALKFATAKHKGLLRKYTDEPYIVHPIAVAELVKSVGARDAVVAAAYLHDTLEDTDTTYAELVDHFGREVADLVTEVTDVSTPEDGNRAKRKAKDLAHLAKASPDGMTIKVADIIDNTKSIVGHDPKFAKTYLVEKAALLKVLTKAHPDLLAMAGENM